MWYEGDVNRWQVIRSLQTATRSFSGQILDLILVRSEGDSVIPFVQRSSLDLDDVSIIFILHLWYASQKENYINIYMHLEVQALRGPTDDWSQNDTVRERLSHVSQRKWTRRKGTDLQTALSEVITGQLHRLMWADNGSGVRHKVNNHSGNSTILKPW